MSFTYGSRTYGAGRYGGLSDPYDFTYPAVSVSVYDANGNRKGFYQTGSGGFLGADFSHNESGCNQFTLYFTGYANIAKKDTIKIMVFDSLDVFFMGVVREIPIDGSTKREFNYSGYGLSDYLERINSGNNTYNSTVYDAVIDLLDNYITVNTPITKNLTKISANLDLITLTAYETSYNNVNSVLSDLRKIMNSDGNNYICGVDQTGDLFFLPRSTEVKKTLIVGKTGRNGIAKYEPNDTGEPVTSLIVLRDDGTYWNTITDTGTTNDIKEEKIQAPAMDDADLALWAAGQLAEKKLTSHEAAIDWQIERWSPTLLLVDGQIRIISNIPPLSSYVMSGSAYGSGTYGSGLYGGTLYGGKDIDDTLPILSVDYKLSNKQAVRNIKLGPVSREVKKLDEAVSKLITGEI